MVNTLEMNGKLENLNKEKEKQEKVTRNSNFENCNNWNKKYHWMGSIAEWRWPRKESTNLKNKPIVII